MRSIMTRQLRFDMMMMIRLLLLRTAVLLVVAIVSVSTSSSYFHGMICISATTTTTNSVPRTVLEQHTRTLTVNETYHVRGSTNVVGAWGKITMSASISSQVTMGETLTSTARSSILPINVQQHGMKSFTTLQCNVNLTSTTSCATTWTSMFGTSNIHIKTLTIPCGTCITMDYNNISNYALDLLGGIDILGKLVFPDTSSNNTFTITTPKIIVQGELQMTATSKPINGIPTLRFIMIGEDETQSFVPIGNNTDVCNIGNAPCEIGKKAIVVAGGQVNLHGLPANTKTWTRLYDVTGGTNYSYPDTIILQDENIKDKWSIGAELVITSHSRYNFAQERTIINISQSATLPGYSEYKLNTPIERPTTIVDGSDFAVEVALLSRNIVFLGGSDATSSQHGGHFMIMNTPLIVQIIDGIEIRNFGQQGLLGRYPIHFHYSDDVPGSIVSKNSIRQSNQRCIVVHGTNKLRIEENVAFDAKGHCYVLEDGIEVDNEFLRNLGAQIRKPDQLIPQSDTANNGAETDDQPAVFWMTSLLNIWEGNVAAGSDDSGYWFDPKIRGKRASLYEGYDPQSTPILAFKDNVVHSSVGRLGAIRTYVPGYRPSSIVTLDGIKCYRNFYVGIHIHRSNNLVIANSLFADNWMGIDIDRAVGIEVVNTTVIGESDSYRKLFRGSEVCHRRTRIGIDLHTWTHEFMWTGAKISNVTMKGFESTTNCPQVSSIRFDDQTVKQGLFEFYSTFDKMSIENGPNSINFCILNQEYYKILYTLDLDGSMKPSNEIQINGTSTLVGTDEGSYVPFVDDSKCIFFENGCYNYCTNTCYRSVRYDVEIPDNQVYILKVCLRNNNTECTTFAGGRRQDFGRYTFNAHLPVGNLYSAAFFDARGREASLTFTQHDETSFCPVDSLFDVVVENGEVLTQEVRTSVLRTIYKNILTFLSWMLNLFRR